MHSRHEKLSDWEAMALRRYFLDQERFSARAARDYLRVHHLVHRVRFLLWSGLSSRMQTEYGRRQGGVPRLEHRLVALFGE